MNHRFWKPGRIAAVSLVALLALGGFVVSTAVLSVKEINIEEVFSEETAEIAAGENAEDYANKVRALSGLQLGQAMLLVSEAGIKKGVESDPQLLFRGVTVEYPSTVKVLFERRVPVAYIPLNDGILLIDCDGLVISKSDSIPLDAPMISEVEIPQAYQARNTDLTADSSLSAVKRSIDILREMRKQKLSLTVSELICTDLVNMYLITQDGMTVKLGDPNDMEQKITLLAATLPHLPEANGSFGILDVTALNKADYINPDAVETFGLE
ncbi:MAG: cell division protein FtsQ/DivIB [Oscillospiraceae bacterium]|jgi:cell division septal protein FtsQ|nr:cell division protein FtsQ/DivIB [Oscillospiraceae bacterium]